MATKRSCCIRFSCFSSSSSSDEKGQDHPIPASVRSSPSAIDNTIETLQGAPKRTEAPIPGSSNVVTPMKYEIEHVDVNLNVSGTYQGDKAPLIESLNILRKSEDEDVNVNLNFSGRPQCNEASSSGSSNVPDISDREDVDANLNVLGAPRCDEAPSSSSSSGATKSDVINTILHKDIAQVKGKFVDVNLDDLMEHISELLKLREEEMLRDKKASNPSNFPWPDVPGFKKLNAIVSWGTDLKNLKELLSSGLEFASKLKDIISGPVKTLMKDIGQVSLATAGLLVVALVLERFNELSTNKEKCWDLIKEMSYVATVVKRFKESPRGTQEDVIQDATTLIIEGAIMCCTQIDRSAWKSFLLTSKTKDELSDIRQKLNVKYMQINIEIGFRVLTAIECKGRSPLSKKYPTHAVGMDEPIKEVLRLLEIESDQNAVTVILHGFGGMGKTTLADAVFSQVGGCKYSKVRLFNAINSAPVIIELQKQILKDLMEAGETVPEIRTHEDGQRELEGVLGKINAFIYVDNVLEGDALKKLLPQDMTTAKKVRFLLTARDENVKNACPRSCTKPKIYSMKGIQHREAMLILKKEIEEGVTDTQLNEIIQICGKIPLMLTLAAPFIGRADNRQEAYSTLMRQKNKWSSEDFKEMRYAFAYDALPHDCKDPFLDICSYFKGWDWETVEDIVGKDELKMLESRALVTRTPNGVASVHDVILTLARQKSEEESNGKEVRLIFDSAIKLKEVLGRAGGEDLKGIWLRDNKDVLQMSASTLDSMYNSLRVLQLGNLTKLEGHCSKILEKLVFFEAKISQLPFDVSESKRLRYLSYEPNGHLKLSKMPSSLRYMEFDGSLHSRDFQISSRDLQQLEHLRIVRLVNFSGLTNLPKEFGDQVKSLQELSLSRCYDIEKLPDSISKLRSLRILKMDYCSSLTELPVDLGSLNSLQELDLAGCFQLKALPDSVEELSSLTLLNLSSCFWLLNLPAGLGKLTCLAELHIDSCVNLKSIPDSIGELKLLRALDLEHCWTLKELPDGFCNLSSITNLWFNGCSRLEKLPDRFGQLESLKALYMSQCQKLEKLPEGFGQLKNLEVLELEDCCQLRELCSDFHCLSSLKILDLSCCKRLEKLPNDFHFLTSLQMLYMDGCKRLEKLPDHFHCLNSLQVLHLSKCPKLEGISMDQIAKMSTLEGVFIKKSAELVKRWAEIQCDCHGSSDLLVISKEDGALSENNKENIKNSVLAKLDCLLTNGRGQPLHLSDLPPNTSTLLIFGVDANHFAWPLIEETINDGMQINIIYIGPHFDQLPTKVKDTIFVVHMDETSVAEIDEKLSLLMGEYNYDFDDSDEEEEDDNSDNSDEEEEEEDDNNDEEEEYNNNEEEEDENNNKKDEDDKREEDEKEDEDEDEDDKRDEDENAEEEEDEDEDEEEEDEDEDNWLYMQMDTKMVKDSNNNNYGPCSCWRSLTAGELEEFVVGNSARYLRLKQLAETDQESNLELLTELFAPQGDETTPVFQKNESAQQDQTENSERKTSCGVDKLKGKTILLEIRPPYNSYYDNSYYDIRLPSLKAMYDVVEKEKLDLEIISIPIVNPSEECDVFDVYEQFSMEVPWFVLQNSWTVITTAVKFFLTKQCGWEEVDACEKWYLAINWIIDPNGRITIYRPSISLQDRGEVFKVLFNHLQSVSYQVRWGVNASPVMYDKIEELRKEEWEQLKNMSTLEFLFNHLESVSVQVKKLLFQGKLICLCSENDKNICSILHAMEQFKDRIHIIHIGRKNKEKFCLTKNIYKDYYYLLENTIEMEGMSLLNLSMQEAVKLSVRLHHLEEEINGMDESDKQLCELKILLHSVQPKPGHYKYGSITFMDEGGKMVAASRGEIFRPDRNDRAQRFIKTMMKDIEGGKGVVHDKDPGVSDSVMKNMETASAAALEQQDMDVYFDSLRECISEVWGVELYQLFKFNKDGRKWSQPKVSWPTSKSFRRFKNFLSKGAKDCWVRYVVSRHPDEKDKCKIVIKSLLKSIEEEEWGVAGLLAVAHVLERFESVSANQLEWLFVLDEMLTLAKYTQQFNQKPGSWTRMKRVAAAIILACSVTLCAQIDQSKFSLFDVITIDKDWLKDVESRLAKNCDRMAEAITEGVGNESESILDQMSDCFCTFLESEDEGL